MWRRNMFLMAGQLRPHPNGRGLSVLIHNFPVCGSMELVPPRARTHPKTLYLPIPVICPCLSWFWPPINQLKRIYIAPYVASEPEVHKSVIGCKRKEWTWGKLFQGPTLWRFLTRMRRRWFGTSCEIWAASRNYLLTNRKRSGSFWHIRSHEFAHYFGHVWYSGARTYLTSCRHGSLNFRRVIYFRFLSEFYFRSHSDIRDSGATTGSPCVSREDHGKGRFYAPYLTRTCHYGCRMSYRAAHIEADSHGRLLPATLPDDVVSMIFFTGNCHLLYSESTQITDKVSGKVATFTRQILRRKHWKIRPKWELLLVLNQSGSRKLAFARSLVLLRMQAETFL